jgi:hypothetical protein
VPLCVTRLGQLDRDEPIVLPDENRVSDHAMARFRSQLQKQTCPAVFCAFLDLFIEGLTEPAVLAFRDLFQIAREKLASLSDLGG